MASDTLDTAEDAAGGDLGAWKQLVMVFGVLTAVVGLMAGLVFTAARGAGSSLRQTLGSVMNDTKESATQNSGTTHGYGGS